MSKIELVSVNSSFSSAPFVQAAFLWERVRNWTSDSARWEAELSLHWSCDSERTTASSPTLEEDEKERIPRTHLFHVHQLNYLLKLICTGPGQKH